MAKAAEVESAMTRPSRLAGMKPPSGKRTPEVVPFQASTTSWLKSTRERSGRRPYTASITLAFFSWSCFTTSVAQPEEKLSCASTSTGRAPSRDHKAISIAPVSEAGTMPSRQSSGMPSKARERVMTSLSRALGSLARCERPSIAPSSADRE
jgi:hypothetical protein